MGRCKRLNHRPLVTNEGEAFDGLILRQAQDDVLNKKNDH